MMNSGERSHVLDRPGSRLGEVDLDLRSRVKSDSSAATASFPERNRFYIKSTLKKNCGGGRGEMCG